MKDEAYSSGCSQWRFVVFELFIGFSPADSLMLGAICCIGCIWLYVHLALVSVSQLTAF